MTLKKKKKKNKLKNNKFHLISINLLIIMLVCYAMFLNKFDIYNIS